MTEASTVCLRQTKMPSSTPLFLDLLYEFDRVRSFYPHPPQISSIPKAAQAIAPDGDHRKRLVAALREQNPGPEAAGHLDLLAKPDTVVVATGQQVGFYGGPVFTLYKALTALKLAAVLRERGTPAVAVFWLATEDHDLAEVDHAWIFDDQHQPLQRNAKVESAAGLPVGGLPLSDPQPEILDEAFGRLPFREEAQRLARSAYGPQCTFQKGFQAFYRELLEAYGLVFLDPMSPALRQLSQPIFRQAIKEAPALSAALLERNEALVQSGYHAQVHFADETSLVFLMEQGRRVPLRREGNRYSGDSGNYSTGELLQRVDHSPQDFSPNALLRPVTQDWLLPTAAYVGGPAELAYLAQAEVLYERLLGRMPVVFPRASFTVVDSRAQRLLDRYRLAITDCFEGPEELRRKIAASLIPPTLETTLTQAEAQIADALARADRELEKFDPTLSAALRSSSEKIRYQFNKIRGKAGQESLRRDSRADEDARYLGDLIYPEKTPQERLYSTLPFVAQYGFEFVDRIYAAIQPDCHDHQILVA